MMHTEIPSHDLVEQKQTEIAAKSSTRRGPHIIGVLLFAWSWFVAGALLLIFAPPVLLIGSLFKRQDWIYWWADWGARNWLRLRSGISFGVCPEGTRAQPGEMLPFKKGAFHMAAQAGVPIVPIALKNSDVLMGKGTGEAWPGTIDMVMLPPVETSWVKDDADLDALVKQVQEIIMRELGVQKLAVRPPKATALRSHK